MLSTSRILVVEDEPSIQTVVRTYLESAGFDVLLADNGADALSLAEHRQPALVILDLNLPGMDGMEVAARLRAESSVYILMLTARSDELDRVAGLRIGADDYLTKPFSPRELVARVEAILRRNRSEIVSDVLTFGDLKIDLGAHEARALAGRIDLTPTEFQLLAELGKHAGRVLTREQLIERVWGHDFYGTDRVVDVFVGQVRRKLQNALTAPSPIETVRGIGYKLVPPS